MNFSTYELAYHTLIGAVALALYFQGEGFVQRPCILSIASVHPVQCNIYTEKIIGGKLECLGEKLPPVD